VTVAMEAWKKGRIYNSEDMRAFYHMNDASFLDEKDREYYQKFRKKAFEALEGGFYYNLSIKALHEKLQEWSHAAIKVEYTGLEEFDRMKVE
jgi:hypothetical protein